MRNIYVNKSTKAREQLKSSVQQKLCALTAGLFILSEERKHVRDWEEICILMLHNALECVCGRKMLVT